MKQFLGGKVTLFGGDSRDVLKEMPDNCIDSIVTDPPYALVSIVKRFGKEGAAPAKGNEAFMRASRGFMGKQWDTGEVAFDPEFWAECMRVLKPGGHLLSFGGTRTYHRMACAIEDAGFEIRDMMQWLYGSGFPKSHDVSKGIDKQGGESISWFPEWLKQKREERNISRDELAKHFPSKNGGKTGCVWNWEAGIRTPSAAQFNKLCMLLGHPEITLQEARREIIAGRYGKTKTFNIGATEVIKDRDPITAPATPAAKEWEGWGTALKPANEPIVLARKPLSEGTVAANVLRWGTGAINIDGCRVELREGDDPRLGGKGDWGTENAAKNVYEGGYAGERVTSSPLGRFPANVIHDGSDEIVDAFPDANSKGHHPKSFKGIGGNGIYNGGNGIEQQERWSTDSGSAARFFYQAKANKKDRAGSKHPTVKPIKLLRYLIRLITPPNGVVLDPFAGSGTTGEAAYMEGFRAILIERETEYQEDIANRLKALDNVIDRTEDEADTSDTEVQQ